MSYHSTLYESSKYLFVNRARIVINGSTNMSPPNDIGIYNAFALRKDRYFMPSFAVILLVSYTGAWNYSSSLILTAAATDSPAVGDDSIDGPVFSAGITAYGQIFQMNAVVFNAGSSGSGIPGQIGCAKTSENTISLTQDFPPGKFICLRNSSTSLPATTLTVDFFLRGYYLDLN